MGRPLNSDGGKTRQAILAQALRLFADKGYFGTTLRDIAGAVGVRESALYNYFSGKEALFNALIDAAHERRAERLSPFLGASGDARALLERLTTLVLEDFSQAHAQQLFRVLMSDGMRLAREGRINLLDRITSGATPLRTLMRQLVNAGQLRRQRPELLACQFMGPLLMWRHWHALDPNGPLVVNQRVFVREHVDHFLRGAAEAASVRPVRAARVSAGRRRRPPIRGRTATSR